MWKDHFETEHYHQPFDVLFNAGAQAEQEIQSFFVDGNFLRSFEYCRCNKAQSLIRCRSSSAISFIFSHRSTMMLSGGSAVFLFSKRIMKDLYLFRLRRSHPLRRFQNISNCSSFLLPGKNPAEQSILKQIVPAFSLLVTSPGLS